MRRSQRRGSRGRRRPRNWSLSPLKISACSIRSSPDSAQRAITLISSSTRSMASIRAGAAQPQMVEGHLIEEDGLTWTSRLYASSPVGWPAPDTGPSRWFARLSAGGKRIRTVGPPSRTGQLSAADRDGLSASPANSKTTVGLLVRIPFPPREESDANLFRKSVVASRTKCRLRDPVPPSSRLERLTVAKDLPYVRCSAQRGTESSRIAQCDTPAPARPVFPVPRLCFVTEFPPRHL